MPPYAGAVTIASCCIAQPTETSGSAASRRKPRT